MGIEDVDELIPVGKIEEKPIPEKDQICKCGHSLARHRTMLGMKGVVCIEQFCPCVAFKVHVIK